MREINKKILFVLSLSWLVIMLILMPIVWLAIEYQITELFEQKIEERSKTIPDFVIRKISSNGVEAMVGSENLIVYKILDKNENIVFFNSEQDFIAFRKNFENSRFSLINTKIFKRIIEKDKSYIFLAFKFFNKKTNEENAFVGVFKIEEGEFISKFVYITMIFVFFSSIFMVFLIYPILHQMNKKTLKFTGDLLKANTELLETLGSGIASRDSDTNEHNYRVTLYSVRIAEELGLDKKGIQGIIKGAFLHDVGKLGIPDSILLKPAKLNDDEYRIMKTHVLLGEKIISKSDWLNDAKIIIKNHHEKYDGSGYPLGISKEMIPLPARIFAVADVFDALTSKRPYKESYSYDKAMEMMSVGVGKHFDPEVWKVFEKNANRWFLRFEGSNSDELERYLSKYIVKYFFEE